ncbi:MAG: hypothetical protein PHU81_09755 [Acidobacteriota bacterium]|nr:hypothetical protein [Acidobacteriota bacterium]
MKNKYFLIITCLLMITLPVFGQNPKIDSIHDLFTDDIGEREELFYNALGSAGGAFSSPAWSPDGKKVAFSFSRMKPLPGEEDDLLCIFNIGEKSLKVISKLDDGNPSWSPDSQQIVFDSGRTGRSEIYKINADGSNLIQMTTTGAGGPVWSPDGGKISYMTTTGIWVMNSDGTNARQITYQRWDGQSSWSPDGLRIAYASEQNGKMNVWVINADGSNPIRITQKGGALTAWSPDGKWIAFYREEQIWLVSPDGQKEVHLRTDFPVYKASWSPDSKKIIVEGMKDFKYDADLYVITIKY